MNTPELLARYQSKTDEELLELAQNRAQLTEEASAVLMGELSRRQIHEIKVEESPQEKLRDYDAEQPEARNVPGTRDLPVGAFMEELLRTYRDHFLFFVKLMAPATVIGYVAIWASRSEMREIARQLPRGLTTLSHRLQMTEISLLSLAGYAVSWIALCVAFGTISSGVQQIVGGFAPSVREAYAVVVERKGPLFRLSLLLFFLLGIVASAVSLLMMGIHWLYQVLHSHRSFLSALVVTYTCTFLGLLVFSRFALSIPALVLDNCRVGQSVFRSDALTERKWLILGVILAKSLVLGYVAAGFPYWITPSIPFMVSLPAWFPWVLSAASIAGVSIVEPLMLIGFALLYTKTSRLSPLSGNAMITIHYPAASASPTSESSFR